MVSILNRLRAALADLRRPPKYRMHPAASGVPILVRDGDIAADRLRAMDVVKDVVINRHIGLPGQRSIVRVATTIQLPGKPEEGISAASTTMMPELIEYEVERAVQVIEAEIERKQAGEAR